MKRVSLKRIYLATLTAVFLVTFALFVAFDYVSQQNQAEEALLEEARTFAREMDAVWQFMDNQQKVINTSSDGDYDFKGLHCSIVGKSVGAIFSYNNDYTIRYTNFEPRSYQDRPDAFEAEALTAFNEDSSVTEYYGVAEFAGEERFRYLQALEVDRSCLECHGGPVGEIDITGHPKEGWTLDSVGGAISIVIPLDQQREAVIGNLMLDAGFFLALTLVIGTVVYWVTRSFVLRPLERMSDAFGKMGERSLEVFVHEGGASREVADLIAGFNDMAEELRGVYENLEDQVADRTRDLKAANAELERQRDSLERLSAELAKESELKSDLLSMVNHEMRTPLTTVIALAHMAIEDCDKRLEVSPTPEEEESRAAWSEVLSSSRNLLGMINNMLDVARSDAGMTTVASELMDLGDVALAVSNTVKPIAKRSGVDFRTHVAADVPLVLGDFEKTGRLLENLAGNAVKFTPEGGAVRLGITLEEGTGDVLMSVADNGIGIAPEDQHRIFEKFVQVDISSRRRYGGNGLGLALVKDYAEAQGFDVALESELGRGSTFTVRIPRDLVVEDDYEGAIS
ncbi:MAG: DUF3365 domain-containing protein [Eggerthellaceae bacterium]|nr:DUF3365 domain-containing protein [Eggerthellaceae bacterium]